MSGRSYIAFVASEKLMNDIDKAVNAERVNYALLNTVATQFIDEMLEAFFIGPLLAMQADSHLVSIIQGIATVINRAAKQLTRRLLKKITLEEQQALADHFHHISFRHEGRPRIGYGIDADFAQFAVDTYQSILRKHNTDIDDYRADLLQVMDGMTLRAIEVFLDDTVAALHVGRITKGIIRAARASMRKGAHTAAGHLSNLSLTERQDVIVYFQDMLVVRPDGDE